MIRRLRTASSSCSSKECVHSLRSSPTQIRSLTTHTQPESPTPTHATHKRSAPCVSLSLFYASPATTVQQHHSRKPTNLQTPHPTNHNNASATSPRSTRMRTLNSTQQATNNKQNKLNNVNRKPHAWFHILLVCAVCVPLNSFSVGVCVVVVFLFFFQSQSAIVRTLFTLFRRERFVDVGHQPR
jgi:Flp pilus assembly protein TadB